MSATQGLRDTDKKVACRNGSCLFIGEQWQLGVPIELVNIAFVREQLILFQLISYDADTFIVSTNGLIVLK